MAIDTHPAARAAVRCLAAAALAAGLLAASWAADAQAAAPPAGASARSQLPAGDVATALRTLAAQPKVEVPAPHIDTPQLPYQSLTARPMWIEKIKDGLYLIRGPLGPCMNACTPGFPRDGVLHEPGDVAVRVTGAGVILVDDKFAVNVPQIVSLVRSVTAEPIKYVVNSHFHSDHAGGNGEMLARGVTIVAQRQLRDSYDRAKRGGASPQIVFGRYGAIVLGHAKVEMYHFGPGHTRGDTIIYFPDLRVIHMGDVVIEGMPHIDYTDGGTALGMVDEIHDMLKLDWDFAIPGHGRILTRAQVQQYAQKFDTMNRRMQQIVRQGIARNRAAAALKLDDLGWANSVSTSTFLANDVGGYYDEMARALAAHKALDTRPTLGLDGAGDFGTGDADGGGP
ncbi:MAG TPA: MBL fold metallo-hydrolase [Steroidobacteraceae bacterium]|jgi:glyoxylase-like metal-dependent hydrolase (beta-lactamase superfamily II)|nr:MBL fold metallo-hydrolase [Steroidobacteraceae bacterium]